MFYVIGQYDDGLNAILGRYKTLKEAQHSIWWQSQPRMHYPDWESSDKFTGRTTDYYRGNAYETTWRICKPSNLKGLFFPLDGGKPIETSKGAFTKEAYTDILNQQILDYMET